MSTISQIFPNDLTFERVRFYFLTRSSQRIDVDLSQSSWNKFEEGWGQCLAEMIAVQRINDDFVSDVYGIVSNGKVWQFGKLNGSLFTRNKNFYMIQDSDKLFAAVNYVFKQCKNKITNFSKQSVIL